MSFLRAYLGEFRKLIRPRGLIILAVIFVIFFIFFAIIYNINFETLYDNILGALEESGMMDGQGSIVYVDGEFKHKVDEGIYISEAEYAEEYGYINCDYFTLANADNVDTIIEELKEYRDYYKANSDSDRFGDYEQQAALLTGSIKILEYMKANNLYGVEVDGNRGGMFSGVSLFFMGSAEGFTQAYFEAVIAILLIYGVVVAAGLYADEYSKGTIKLVMLRPVSRNTMTTAKLLALFSYLSAILFSATFIAFIYGIIKFGSNSTDTLLVLFNNRSVFKSTVGGKAMLEMFLQLIELFASVSFAYMLGTVMRKKTGAIVLSFVILAGIVSAIFSAFGVGIERFLFSTNTDLTRYFGLPYNMSVKDNFFIALPVLVGYLAAILAALYLTVEKRDVI